MAQRKPGKENIVPGYTPVPSKVQAAPDAPSPEKLAAKAKEIASKPRKPKKTTVESKEEISNQIKVAEHFKLAEDMARDTVDIIDIGMSHVDDMYESELKWVREQKHEKWTFQFNKKEGETVGNACYTVYQKIDPARLAAWGGFMTVAALLATVLLPRMKMASELSQLRKDLEDRAKARETAHIRPLSPPVSTSRAPGVQAPSPASTGVPVQGADGKVRHIDPTDSAAD